MEPAKPLLLLPDGERDPQLAVASVVTNYGQYRVISKQLTDLQSWVRTQVERVRVQKPQ